MKSSLNVLVLAAGRGTRMKSELPKVLHPLQGIPMIRRVVEPLLSLGVQKIVVVVGYGEADIRKALAQYGNQIEFVRQKKQLGTGHAVNSAAKAFATKSGDILILAGDAPFLGKKILAELIRQHFDSKSRASILSARVNDPTGYGRILRDSSNNVIAIREELDASSSERSVNEINSGAYIFNKSDLFRTLKKIKPANQKSEYYLTDTIEFLIREGVPVEAFCLAGEEEVMGINSRKDLVEANLRLYRKKAAELLESGVTVISPENTFIASDVIVGQDSIIYPFTYIERNVKIGKGCRVGPFTYIREGSTIEDKAQIGSFVEVVRSRVGKGTNIKHLSYVGDAQIGEQANLGAGTITANYDGAKKHKTIIGDGAFIGSNTVLIAPVKVGKNSKTGAGSVLLAEKNIPNGQVFAGVPAKKIGTRK